MNYVFARLTIVNLSGGTFEANLRRRCLSQRGL